MARIYDVITVGEAKIDEFMTIHDSSDKVRLNEKGELCFRHGEKINVERYDFCLGGNAANVAVGITRLGLKATIAAEVGDDEFSLKIRNFLATEHIERQLVVQKKEASNFSVIINFKGDRTIFSEHLLRENDFDFEEVSAKWIYLTSLSREWEGAYKKALEFAKKENCKIAFNPGHFQLTEGREVVHEVLSQTEILIVNKEEGELILHNHYNKKIDNTEHYIKNLCIELQKLGPKIVVVTNGKHGSFVLSESGEFKTQDLYPGKVVERTGAGDGFATGFLGAIIYGEDLQTALKRGSVNASSVVGQVGAEAGLLTKEEIEGKL